MRASVHNSSCVQNKTRQLPFFILAVALIAQQAGCSAVICGDGTVEKEGVCVTADAYLKCGSGLKAVGTQCVPTDGIAETFCDDATSKWDPVRRKCLGTGTAGGDTCTKKCGPPNGSEICIQGRFVVGEEYFQPGVAAPTVIRDSEGGLMQVTNPGDFLITTTPAPIATTSLDPNGCFIVSSVAIPFTGGFGLWLDDPFGSTAPSVWAYFATVYVATSGKNLENLELPAFRENLVEKLGRDIYKEGGMLIAFRDAATRKIGIQGVVPTINGAPPPWDGGISAHYGSDEWVGKNDLIDDALESTGKSGVVFLKKAPISFTLGGIKTGCTVKNRVAGGVPGNVAAWIVDVSGC